VLVNPFSGKVRYPSHLRTKCLALHPESELDLKFPQNSHERLVPCPV